VRGPSREPSVLRLLKGNPLKRPIRPEPQPPRTTELPWPSSFIVGYAADERWRIAPALHQMGLLGAIDMMPLAAY